MAESGNREKGAACARFFSRILIWPKKGKKPRRLLALSFYPDDRTAAFGDADEIAWVFEDNQHPDIAIRTYLFEIGLRVRFQMNYSFLKRCPSPLSSKVHGSPRMWYPPCSQLSQKPGRSASMNSTPRTHFALFQA